MQPVRIALVVMVTGGFASTQAAVVPMDLPGKASTLCQVLDGDRRSLKREFVPAVKPMAADTFNIALRRSGIKDGESKGVKTFAGHVCQAEASDTLSALGPWGSKDATTRLSLATHFMSSAFDHGCPMVASLRMNHIIPPARRR